MITLNNKLAVLSHSAKLLSMIQQNLIEAGISDEAIQEEADAAKPQTEDSLYRSLGSAEALLLRYYYQLALDEGRITPTEIENSDEEELEWESKLTA